MRWDIFCRVIDNYGDIGVCWRLSADLAARGESVRLWLDDTAALSWMAPQQPSAMQVLPWRDPQESEQPGEVVIEAFGCELPEAFVQRMAAARRPPVWINLEYLSAETYVERSHGLASPQSSGAGRGLNKWFFYPGFNERTGGLIREPGLAAAQQRYDAARWRSRPWLPSPAQQEAEVVSLFCYENPGLHGWLDHRAREQPTRLLVTPGHAARQVGAWLGCEPAAGETLAAGYLQLHFLPWLDQDQYDELLWACDLNFVRGEDSLTRALWAGRPFVWQLYPQADGAHWPKLAAFLRFYTVSAPAELGTALQACFNAWNGSGEAIPTLAAELRQAWRDLASSISEHLWATTDLTTDLIRFIQEKS